MGKTSSSSWTSQLSKPVSLPGGLQLCGAVGRAGIWVTASPVSALVEWGRWGGE